MQFRKEEVRASIATMPCRHCGTIGAVATIEIEGPHFARIECPSCGYWIDWLGWPADPAKPERRKRRQITKLGDDRCEMCLRSRFELPPPDTLQAHHVIEHAVTQDDSDDNIRWYCTSCHGLVGWLRTYFGHYHPSADAA